LSHTSTKARYVHMLMRVLLLCLCERSRNTLETWATKVHRLRDPTNEACNAPRHRSLSNYYCCSTYRRLIIALPLAGFLDLPPSSTNAISFNQQLPRGINLNSCSSFVTVPTERE
jgi:hypothetical protein